MTIKPKNTGLFDVEFRFEKVQQYNHPLQKLHEYIDFDFFRTSLERFFNKDKDFRKGGRPPYDYVLMFKILILQRYYNLSDDNIEFSIADRISFMQFLGLSFADNVPDAKTIWNFRDKLAHGGMIEKLFEKLDKQLDHDGITVHKGKMIDATIVEAPIQRNTREENQQIKKGEIPSEWKDQPDKLKQKDTDADWTSKGGKNYFGYKNHVKADTETKLITGYCVTTASTHDSVETDNLTDKKEDGDAPLYADSAYRSEEIEKMLKKKNIESQVHEKGYRNHPLTSKQIATNKKKSKTRARVEHIFGFMTNSMNGIKIRCRNMFRATASIGLMNLTYNLFRLVQLNVELSA